MGSLVTNRSPQVCGVCLVCEDEEDCAVSLFAELAKYLAQPEHLLLVAGDESTGAHRVLCAHLELLSHRKDDRAGALNLEWSQSNFDLGLKLLCCSHLRPSLSGGLVEASQRQA